LACRAIAPRLRHNRGRDPIGILDRNRFGVIALEPSGTSTTPPAFTQLFVDGEAWGLSTHFFARYQGYTVIPTVALENIYRCVLANYCEVFSKGLSMATPYTVILGAVGLKDLHVGLNNSVDGPFSTTASIFGLSCTT
jgi:hypothetical protein